MVQFSEKVMSMKISLASKIQYLLFVLIVLFNPISVSADASLFDSNDQNLISSVMSEMDNNPSCHDENAPTDSQVSDCCEDPCSCGESGCHASLAVLDQSGSNYYSASNAHSFEPKSYASLSSSPSSPPPIV